jgi:hypothetical protein
MSDDAARSPNPDNKKPAPGSVFSLGWLMSELFGPLRPQAAARPAAAQPAAPSLAEPATTEPTVAGWTAAGSAAAGDGAPTGLPTVDELSGDEQTDLALRELGGLLKACVPALTSSDIQGAWDRGEGTAFAVAVQDLHQKILWQLTGDEQQLSAYQLGCALSDMCRLPEDEPAGFFLQEFDRSGLATLQTWLAKASGVLPAQSAATVSRSLQNWQDWADINASRLATGWPGDRAVVAAALQTQGQAWHALLVGETDISGQTSVDAWVEAGESILRGTWMLTLRILRRFWPVVVIILAATGGLLYVVSANTQGTSAVWASLVTVAGAFGLSGASLRAAAKKAVSGLEQDLSNAAEMDARAWGVTWLPTLPQGFMQRHELRRRGVDAPHVKKGLEPPAPPALPGAGVQP